MPATTNVNFRTVVHEKSSGMAIFFPDVCKTPAPPAGPIPIPYPNIAQSTDTDGGSTKVKIDGCPIMLKDSNFKMSSGDEAGAAGGIMSSCTKGKAEFLNYSFDVKIEGKNVPRLGDMMLGNKKNTPPMPEIQPPAVIVDVPEPAENEKEWSLKKMEVEDPDAEDETEPEGSGGGTAARKGGKAPGGGGLSGEKAEKKKAPTIKAKWSKKQIAPLHNKNEVPTNAPLDDIPEISQVDLEVETTEVPDGTAASIEILHAHTGSRAKNGSLKALKVVGNKVVDAKTNKAPKWSFDSAEKLWEPWDKPFYHFSVTVDLDGLSAETPRDFKAKESECLRILYLHACVSDAEADAKDKLKTQEEMRDISAILESNPNHKSFQRVFKASDIQETEKFKALWGSVARNTYVYHQGSHGGVMCEIDGEFFMSDSDDLPTHCPLDDSHKGMSVAVLLNKFYIRGDWIQDKKNTPSVPKYLAYFNCCQTGWDARLSKALVGRGTRNVIAFRKLIGDTTCVALAKNFYTIWIKTHQGDPAKIPSVFFDVGASSYSSLRPVLYGKGGGKISDPDALSALEIAGIAVAAIAGGILVGIAVAGLIKSL